MDRAANLAALSFRSAPGGAPRQKAEPGSAFSTLSKNHIKHVPFPKASTRMLLYPGAGLFCPSTGQSYHIIIENRKIPSPLAAARTVC